jgi:uncharacterized protein
MTELGSTLCTSCGLCCSGVLFTRATLRPDEVAHAKRHALTVIQRDDGPSFTLPCHLLHDRKCGIYAERPGICSAFRCKLLMKLEDGEISFEDALAKVKRLDALHTRVRTAVDPKSLEALLDLGEMEALATRDFREPPPASE